MLNVVKEQIENGLLIRLTGVIDESVNFSKLLGEPPANLHVNCKGVSQVTSVGVKSWISYFNKAASKGSSLTFKECSTAVIDQINHIVNFTCGGTVESVFVPFICQNCKAELVGLLKTQAIAKVNFQLPSMKCSKCGGKAVFDDVPEEYFSFMIHHEDTKG